MECHGENVAGDEYFLVVRDLISALSDCEILILARLKCKDIQRFKAGQSLAIRIVTR